MPKDPFVYNFSEEVAAPPPDLEEGDYVMTLIAVDKGMNSNGKPYLRLRFKLDDYDDAELTHTIYVTRNSRKFLVNLLVSLGIDPDGEIHLLKELENNIGTKVIGHVKHTERNNGKKWLNISNFKRFVEVIENPPDDEIPF